jgi:hypothetical protein
MNNIKCGDKVIYKEKERIIKCIDEIESLLGLEPITEPEDVVWVRFENCSLLEKKNDDSGFSELLSNMDLSTL